MAHLLIALEKKVLPLDTIKVCKDLFQLQPFLHFTYIRNLSDTISPNLKSFAKDKILWSATRSRSSSQTTLAGYLSRTINFAFLGKINFNCNAVKPG